MIDASNGLMMARLAVVDLLKPRLIQYFDSPANRACSCADGLRRVWKLPLASILLELLCKYRL